ncbi:MAG: hypothetical protein JG767_1070 [Deferribacteraceae bacterium]|jgi:hypothetical protein|nr:hypothetical protein [Deferribacteraceae bacterium]
MSKSLVVLKYFADAPLSFIAFLIARIPLWTVLYLYFAGKMSAGMFVMISVLIYLSRSYFDVEVFNLNPFYSIFCSVFYSVYKPLLMLAVLIIFIVGLYYFAFTKNLPVFLVIILLLAFFVSGMSVFFRKDYLNGLWRIKNAPGFGHFIKNITVEILWFIVITMPLSNAFVGLFIIYTIEFGNFVKEFDEII